MVDVWRKSVNDAFVKIVDIRQERHNIHIFFFIIFKIFNQIVPKPYGLYIVVHKQYFSIWVCKIGLTAGVKHAALTQGEVNEAEPKVLDAH